MDTITGRESARAGATGRLTASVGVMKWVSVKVEVTEKVRFGTTTKWHTSAFSELPLGGSPMGRRES